MRCVPEETIDIDDDDDDELLSQDADASETLALSTSPTNAAQIFTKRLKPFSTPKPEGAYVDALRGNNVFPPSSRNAVVRAVVTGGGDGRGDVCFECGKVGHWSRDCDSVEMVAGGGGAAEVETNLRVCGAGDCLVLTANTEEEVLQENGGCTFFEWCDGVSATASRGNTNIGYDNNGFSSQFPALPCPCGAGSCLILTAKTGNNVGLQFYHCPASQRSNVNGSFMRVAHPHGAGSQDKRKASAKERIREVQLSTQETTNESLEEDIQGSSCGVFKWCRDQITAAGKLVNLNRSYNSFDNSRAKASWQGTPHPLKCGQEGHWARDCSQSATEFSRSGMKPSTTSSTGSCYKCGTRAQETVLLHGRDIKKQLLFLRSTRRVHLALTFCRLNPSPIF